jgi:hypothetical protein
VSDAVLEGKAMRKEEEGEEKSAEDTRIRSEKSARRAPKVVDVDEELEDNALLGEATLAKLSAAREDVAETPAPAEKTEPSTPAAPQESGAKDTE